MIGIGPDGPSIVAIVDLERSRGAPEIGLARGGGENDSGGGPGALDERDVDGELAVALQEFLGAIEGIDAEEAVAQQRNMAI